MPVPTLVTDLSTTLASNSPAGSDNVFPDLDNYLRAMSGFIASIRDNSGNGWVSPYLPLTYAAGTANGVVYLNGSKVVTTGSALVFDGTNLGLGVTPSAWGASGQKAFQLAGLGALSGGYDYSISTSNNAMRVSGGGWQYMLTGQLATLYQQISGTHTWSSAPSGTAGVPISFTQAMTLDASGNLGVGTASPAAKLQVVGGQVLLDNGQFYGIKTSGGANNSVLNLDASNNLLVGAGGATVTTQLWTGGAERMRLDSSGNLGIGTTSPAQRLDVVTTSATVAKFTRDLATDVSLTIGADNDGAIIGTDGVNVMRMFTGGSERARITSAGDLLVGTTGNANNYKTHILTTGAGAAIGIFQNNPTTPYGINVYYGAAAPNNANANTSFLYCNDTSTVRIQLSSNGGVTNYQANNTNLSDRREKTNFAPAKSYLDTICAIPVQTFEYIDQSPDDPGLTLGVVAQDVQAVAPELVMESNWGTEDNPKMRLSIYQTDLQYALMKCIQEQQAIIEDLRARVAALEAA